MPRAYIAKMGNNDQMIYDSRGNTQNIAGDHIAAPVWKTSTGHTAYPDAFSAMEERNQAVQQGRAEELIWLLEHPALYTAGTSADPAELLTSHFPVYETGRGGRYTYHGPGQRVGYLMLNLNNRGRDVRHFVHSLEAWLIDTLGDLGITAWRAEGRVGIWTRNRKGEEAKIGAIGIRVRKWVTMHGFAVNIDPDLSHFGGIVPCGIAEYPVTSMADLGLDISMQQFDAALRERCDGFLRTLQQ